MTLRIYNTATRQKESIETIDPGKVRMYVCGPTVYDCAHVGHLMSALVFDVIRRYLEFRGYQVRHVMNFTDVDDKIIQRANEQEADPFDLAEFYIQEFRAQLDDFNVLQATVNPRATQDMEMIIEMIAGLIDKGFAYEAQGDVYFRVRRDDDYGKLSRRNLEDMQAGARIAVDERKEDPMDFALWKSAKPGEPAWDSPWSKGRPGWHIECSAMNLAHLGEQIDIHGGGNDLIFPHHENEIAQTESLTNKQFARYWVHNGMVQLSGEKMSKSLGNLITVQEFLAHHEADILRMMVLNSNYRSPLTYKDEVVAQAERSLERLRSALRPALSPSDQSGEKEKNTLNFQMESTQNGFMKVMDDDFNTAGAMGYIFDLVRAINHARDTGMDAVNMNAAQELLTKLTGILGLRLIQPTADGQEASPFIDLIVELRSEFRSQKNWEMSDTIRNRLLELGITLEDSKEGSTWRKLDSKQA